MLECKRRVSGARSEDAKRPNGERPGAAVRARDPLDLLKGRRPRADTE